MKRSVLLLPCVLSLLLVACGTQPSASHELHYDAVLSVDEPAKRIELIQQLERVTMRKIGSFGIPAAVSAVPRGDGGTLTVSGIDHEETAQFIDGLLTEEASFAIRLLVPPEEGQVEQEWEETDIDGSHLTWVDVIAHPEQGAGVELVFDEQGKELFRALIAAHAGRTAGVFVRDLLISQVTIEAEDMQEHILITGIPSLDIAQVFAEDVNVGLHVRLIHR